MIKGFLDLPWFIWAALSLFLAVVWVYLGPHTKMTASPGFRFIVIRWGHASSWLLLSINFALRGVSPDLSGAANIIAAAGGLIYALFIIMTFVLK